MRNHGTFQRISGLDAAGGPGGMMDGKQLDVLWQAVRKRLRLELGDNTFKSWIQPLVLLDLTAAGDLMIGAPTSFMRDRVRSQFLDRLTALWRSECPVVRRVDLTVTGAARPARPAADGLAAAALPSSALPPSALPPSSVASAALPITQVPPAPPLPEPVVTLSLPATPGAGLPLAADNDGFSAKSLRLPRPIAASLATAFDPAARTVALTGEPSKAAEASVVMPFPAAAKAEDDGIGAPLDPRYVFENFVVGKSNELAYAAARRVAEDPTVKFNPLFLYGGVGLGKTHLMHAIAWAIRERSPHRRVIYLSAEKFMFQFVKAIRHNDQMAFKEQFRSVDVLMIDDVQFISGKNSTQEEFFHTFNALVDHNRQIIISADRSPTDLDGIEERIKSRLGWGLAADIHQTDYELRLGILQSKLEKLGKFDMSPKVIEFLAYRITSNVRELEGALNRVVAFADLTGRQATIEMAQEVLQDLLRANDRRVTIEDIQKRVAEYYSLRLEELLSQRRARQFARPRQVAMYLAKQLTTRSLPEIGKRFGGRDHTTVIHAVRKIEELCAIDAALLEQVDSLRRMLET